MASVDGGSLAGTADCCDSTGDGPGSGVAGRSRNGAVGRISGRDRPGVSPPSPPPVLADRLVGQDGRSTGVAGSLPSDQSGRSARELLAVGEPLVQDERSATSGGPAGAGGASVSVGGGPAGAGGGPAGAGGDGSATAGGSAGDGLEAQEGRVGEALAGIGSAPPAQDGRADGALVAGGSDPPAQDGRTGGTLVAASDPPAQDGRAGGTLVGVGSDPPAQDGSAGDALVGSGSAPPAQDGRSARGPPVAPDPAQDGRSAGGALVGSAGRSGAVSDSPRPGSYARG